MGETLGKRIGRLRRAKEMKQDDLAKMLDISPQAVSKWENDQTCPDISLLPKLAQILGVSLDELLSESAPEQPAVRLLPQDQRKDIKEMLLRIVIDSAEGDKVRINVPMALVQIALDTGISMPQISGNEALKNIDLSKIIALVQQGAVGNLVEVETANGDTVRIFVE